MCVFLDGMVVRNALDDRFDIVLTQVYSGALDAKGQNTLYFDVFWCVYFVFQAPSARIHYIRRIHT